MAKHDWKSLKSEFVRGKAVSLTQFFEKKGISVKTWGERTKGWKAAQDEHREKTLKKIEEKSIEIQSERLAQRAEDAQEMMDFSIKQFKNKKAKLSVRQAADVYKIAAEVQDRAMRPLTLPKDQQVPDGAAGFMVGVEISDDDRKSIRIVAKSIANSQAGL